jgi:hypothetical protein
MVLIGGRIIMQLPRTTLVFGLVLCVGSSVAQGQDREQVIAPAAKVREAMERLEAKINRLEKGLQQARQELADLKEADIRSHVPHSRPTPYLRFPVEVERAMMGDAWRLRPLNESQLRQLEGSRRLESAPLRQRRP